MSHCVLSDKVGRQDNSPTRDEPQKYIDEEDIAVTLGQKSEAEAKTPLIDECSMPTAPSVIAHRQHQQQQNNNNNNNLPQHLNNNNNNHHIQIGHNANNNGCASISSRSTSATLPIDQSHSTKTAPPSHKKETSKNEANSAPTCCCGLVQLNYVAFGLAVVEFAVFALQLIACFVDLFCNDDQFAPKSAHAASAVPAFLTIISLCLAITAVVLLVFGVLFRSPYLLVPHLLMQFALMIATLVLFGYLFLWWTSGITIGVSAIIIETSEHGYQGLLTAKNRPPFTGNYTIDVLNTMILLCVILTVVFFGIQICLFRIVITILLGLLKQPKDTVPITPTHSDTVDSCTTVMMMSTVSSRSSPPSNSGGNHSLLMNGGRHQPKRQQQHNHQLAQQPQAVHHQQQHII
ncbi:hypothetical protein GPALN_010738 [Globodera pallida]|nr:hypothetical protein GPALN_010738 [Globodera pallida]